MAVTSLAGHARTKRVITKTPANREEILTDLIERYHETNMEKRALEKAQKELHQQIAGMLEIPIDKKEVIFATENLEAKHYWPVVRSITPHRLYEYDPEFVWRLCTVPMGAAEQSLPADVFHEMVEVRYADTPQLRIQKIVKKDSEN